MKKEYLDNSTKVKLDINKLTLKFNDSSIESNFNNQYFVKSLKAFRISFVTVILLYCAFGILDFLTSADFVRSFFIVRYLVIFPALFSVFLFSFHKKFIHYWQILISICFFIGGAGIIFMLHKNPDNIYYYGGMFLIFMAGYFFIKLNFIGALISGTLLIVVYNLSALLLSPYNETQFEYLIATNAFYISANLIGIFALYNLEYLERSDFYQRFLLAEKQKEIVSINESLENQVAERTKLLNERNKNLTTEIEKRKETETELVKAKEKAEESDLLKSAFLSNMSHEIRTPMNGILGFIDLLESPGISREEQIQYFNIVRQSSNRLLDTINDIIEISKIEARQTPMNFSMLNLDELFTYQYEFFKPEAENKNIELSFFNSLNDIFIETDSNKLESILINLVKNAIKFTKKGKIEFGCNQQNNMLVFYVKDTGIGIAQNRINSIFKRFEQGDIGKNRGYEGSGLGLSIAKAYSEMLGGNIWVESEKDKGSTFYFSIQYKPLVNQTANKQNMVFSENMNLTEKVILVAEDDLVSFALLEVILAGNNYKLVHAKNGLEVIKNFNENQGVDIILMDIKMPEMDGLTATQQIRKLNKKIPIIALSAYALPGDRQMAIENGCTDYITKPIVQDDLKKVLEKYLA